MNANYFYLFIPNYVNLNFNMLVTVYLGHHEKNQLLSSVSSKVKFIINIGV